MSSSLINDVLVQGLFLWHSNFLPSLFDVGSVYSLHPKKCLHRYQKSKYFRNAFQKMFILGIYVEFGGGYLAGSEKMKFLEVFASPLSTAPRRVSRRTCQNRSDSNGEKFHCSNESWQRHRDRSRKKGGDHPWGGRGRALGFNWIFAWVFLCYDPGGWNVLVYSGRH